MYESSSPSEEGFLYLTKEGAMSERFGIADHDAQIPDHAPANPTPSYPVGGMGGDFGYPAPAPPVYGGYSGGSSGGYSGGYSGSLGGTYVPRRLRKRSMILAVILATVLGPLGLFYVNFLSGVAALFVVPFAVRFLAFAVALEYGGGMDMVVRLAVPILWGITIPWSIIGVLVHNARIE